MTLTEFVKKFEKHAKDADWKLDGPDNDIIRTSDGVCPGCFLATALGLNPGKRRVSPMDTHLDLDNVDALISTADNFTWIPGFDPDVRARMLKACGL